MGTLESSFCAQEAVAQPHDGLAFIRQGSPPPPSEGGPFLPKRHIILPGSGTNSLALYTPQAAIYSLLPSPNSALPQLADLTPAEFAQLRAVTRRHEAAGQRLMSRMTAGALDWQAVCVC